jgi:hypothetical protein
MREGTEKFNDEAKGGYSYAEKLALVAQEAMDPSEIGLETAAQARAKIVDKPPALMKLSDFVTFEASVVPPQLRAHWAYQDLTIKPENMKAWEADWCEQHKNEYAIQGLLHSGGLAAQVGQLFTDPILGFCEMLRKAAELLEKKYEELKKTDPNPIITRDEATKESS